ncbi:MAG: UTP--glucose-1-phosphate uridylyltransferase [Saccharofermentanales bacterium]
MSERVKLAMDYCIKQHQEHLLDYLKPVFSDKADYLAQQILKTDFSVINRLYEQSSKQNPDLMSQNIKPIKSFNIETASKEQKDEMSRLGIDAIKRGEVASVTMAGGQGTRLGHNGPKGSFILGTEPPKSLFEIQADRLLEIHTKTNTYMPWLIMTSEENSDATIEFFKQNDYFSYDPRMIRFFKQEMIPVVDFDGKVLVNESGLIFSPNGNGGVFSSLRKSGEYKWLQEQGIRKIFICGVDNVLVRLADPLFIGFSIQSGKAVSAKSTYKKSYDESAGVFCYKDDKPFYIEYTEISETDAKAVDENNQFLFGDIGIVMYVFDIGIIDQISLVPLPYHIAKKKTPFILPSGVKVYPACLNSIKFETFIFDSFALVEDISILRVAREEEFAPVKNLAGEDSSETALKMYNQVYGSRHDFK